MKDSENGQMSNTVHLIFSNIILNYVKGIDHLAFWVKKVRAIRDNITRVLRVTLGLPLLGLLIITLLVLELSLFA